MIADYASLQTTMASFLNRLDLTAMLPTFIQLAEAEMFRDLWLEGSFTEATNTIVAETLTLPADLKQLINIRLNASGYGPMTRVEGHVLDRMRVNASVDFPQYYTTEGTQLRFYPCPPSTGVTVQISYYAAIPILSVSNTSNYVLATFPDLYLYGSLKHTAPFLRDDERVALWDALYQKAKEAAIIANERQEYGASPMVIRPRKAFGPGRSLSGVILR